LAPGETVFTEAGAMSSMDAGLDLAAQLSGGLLSAMGKKVLGGESLFVSQVTNNTAAPQRLTVAQGLPGDIRCVELDHDGICLQPGAYLASTPDVKLGVKWAGVASGLGREGFFKLNVSGTGMLWYGAYGGLVEKDIDGKYLVDTGHLVAYEPQLRLKVALAGGLLSSVLGGEGLVTRVEGRGRIVVQTRSLGGLAGWLNPKL